MLLKRSRRTPRHYDGTKRTTRQLDEVLTVVLAQVGDLQHARPDLIVAAWPDLIGPQHAKMTHAESFIDGVLTVRVTNSTLFSLLVQRERSRLLRSIRKMFPKAEVKGIYFRMG
jgi:hypothetical protein